MNLVSKLLLLFCALSLSLSGARVWALETGAEVACADCHQHGEQSGHDDHGETGSCPCACHAWVSAAVLQVYRAESCPVQIVVERVVLRELLASDGPVFGIEYPPQNS